MAREMKDSGIEWVGKIPKEWNVIKFKYIFSLIGGNGFPEFLQGNESGEYPFCKVSDINGDSDYVDTAANYVSADIVQSHHFNIIPVNSIIVAKIGAALHKNHRKVNSVPCCIDNNTQALVPIRNDFIRYLLYLTKCIDMAWFDNNSTVPSINNNKLLNFFVPNPNINDQHRIAAFLDRKCAEIDSVIADTQKTIEEYKALKQSIITEAVTKGVRGERKMKDSGVEWLPEIPEDWDAKRGKQLFVETNERSVDGHEELLTVSHITGVTPRSAKNVNMFMSESLVDYKICHVGDLAANTMWMWQGAIGVSNYEGVISPSYNTYRQRTHAYYSGYLEYLLRVPVLVSTYAAYSTGITVSRLRLYPDQFFSIVFPVPSNDEQKEIATHLDTKCAEIDRLIAAKQQLLTELESYKKSVIYEYVTGKKEVQ